MVDRLQSETKQKANQFNTPLDDNIHRFNELLDIIDRPVNTDDYNINVPHRTLIGPTQSVVEVNQPQLAPGPPDPEEAVQLEAEKETQVPGEPVEEEKK